MSKHFFKMQAGLLGLVLLVPSISFAAVLPAFHAHLGGAYSIGAGYSVVPLTVVDFDNTGAYSTSTSKFTPRVSGYYVVAAASSVNVGTVALNNRYGVRTVFNGGDYFCIGQQIAQAVTLAEPLMTNCVKVWYFNGTTDNVEFGTFSDSATTVVAGVANTYFSASYIGAATSSEQLVSTSVDNLMVMFALSTGFMLFLICFFGMIWLLRKR